MKKTKIFAAIGGLGLAALSIFLVAADHVDSPSVASTTGDIADVYAFEGGASDKTVLVATLQGPLTPGAATNDARFDENVIVEFNIDNTGDFVEDLVIQAVRRGDNMYIFGPVAPTATGLSSQINTTGLTTVVPISTATNVETATNGGMVVFAGPRRDPFFFDFNRFNEVKTGSVAPAGFLPPGQASDFFANLNVLSVVVEVPNSMLGNAPTHVANGVGGVSGLPNAYNVWVTTKRKQ